MTTEDDCWVPVTGPVHGPPAFDLANPPEVGSVLPCALAGCELGHTWDVLPGAEPGLRRIRMTGLDAR